MLVCGRVRKSRRGCGKPLTSVSRLCSVGKCRAARHRTTP